MLDWLDRQRKKTKAERARIAFLIALSCTLVIALFWFFTLPAKFQDFGRSSDTNTPAGDDSPRLDRNSIENAIESVQQQYAPGTTTDE